MVHPRRRRSLHPRHRQTTRHHPNPELHPPSSATGAATDPGRWPAHSRPVRRGLIATLVQLRSELKNDPDPRIAAAAPAIKATVNSVAYGIPIEVNPTPEAGGTHVTVHQPDGTTYDTRVPRTEEPGQFFHPLLATWVAGAGRLLLAVVMRMAKDLNGSYAFCDTDSLFIAATQQGGMLTSLGGTDEDVDGTEAIRLLTWPQVADIADRLTALNP